MTGQGFHRFGPFVIVRELGRGGMGEVFLARTPWAEHPLAAVKRLRPDVARVPTFVERFRHEAALAVRLSHPNIVATLDVGAVDEQLYVAAELILGKDTGYIADRLRLRSQGGPAAVAIRLVLDGLEGLAYVHGATDSDGASLELVHRDVTPGNLLVGYDGRARLADFGLAKSHLSEGHRLTKQGEILGTPHYLAPEVVKDGVAHPASDIYGLGAVIYRFLTGIAPFQGGTSEVLMKVLTERPRPLAELRPDLPRWLVELFERLLTPELRQRPSDARRLAVRIQDKAKSEDILVPRAAVGRWLAQLFATEHTEETEEHARLAALDPSQLEPPKEGTVVLARAVEEPRIFGPDPFLSALSDEEVRGTELAIEASALLGMSPPVEDYGPEMPTRAVEVIKRSAGPSNGPEADTDLDTDIERIAARRKRLGLDPKQDDEEEIDETADGEDLPGFVDAQGGGSSETRASSSVAMSKPSAPGTEGDARPSSPERGAVVAEPSDPLLVTPVADGSPQRPVPSDVVQAEDTSSGPVAGLRRSILFLAGLLSLAVALGIGLGKVVAHLRASAEPVAVPIEGPDSAKLRLDRLHRRLERLQGEGHAVSPEAWRHVALAAAALLEGRRAQAQRHLDQVEALTSAGP